MDDVFSKQAAGLGDRLQASQPPAVVMSGSEAGNVHQVVLCSVELRWCLLAPETCVLTIRPGLKSPTCNPSMRAPHGSSHQARDTWASKAIGSNRCHLESWGWHAGAPGGGPGAVPPDEEGRPGGDGLLRGRGCQPGPGPGGALLCVCSSALAEPLASASPA